MRDCLQACKIKYKNQEAMKTIKIKFHPRTTDYFVRAGYNGPGNYEIDGVLYYVRASTNYKYLATQIKDTEYVKGILTKVFKSIT